MLIEMSMVFFCKTFIVDFSKNIKGGKRKKRVTVVGVEFEQQYDVY
jgi:hypothetical protein